MTEKEKKLTPKQEAFCQEYIKDFNATQAAVRAGYSERTAKECGYELLTKLHIQGRVAQLKAKRCERTQIDADWVLRQAAEVHRRCMQIEPAKDADGKYRGTFKFDASNANRALELVGKHVNVQAFKDTVRTEVAISHEEWLDSLE